MNIFLNFEQLPPCTLSQNNRFLSFNIQKLIHFFPTEELEQEKNNYPIEKFAFSNEAQHLYTYGNKS